jgi:hypothetical protein
MIKMKVIMPIVYFPSDLCCPITKIPFEGTNLPYQYTWKENNRTITRTYGALIKELIDKKYYAADFETNFPFDKAQCRLDMAKQGEVKAYYEKEKICSLKKFFEIVHSNNPIEQLEKINYSAEYLNELDAKGISALEWAQKKGNKKLENYLVERGADLQLITEAQFDNIYDQCAARIDAFFEPADAEAVKHDMLQPIRVIMQSSKFTEENKKLLLAFLREDYNKQRGEALTLLGMKLVGNIMGAGILALIFIGSYAGGCMLSDMMQEDKSPHVNPGFMSLFIENFTDWKTYALGAIATLTSFWGSSKTQQGIGSVYLYHNGLQVVKAAEKCLPSLEETSGRTIATARFQPR